MLKGGGLLAGCGFRVVNLPFAARMMKRACTATWAAYPRPCFLELEERRSLTFGGKPSTCAWAWSTRDPHVIRELSCSSTCHWRCLCVSRRQLFTEVYLVTNADKWVAAIAQIGWCLETLPSFCFSFHSCSLTRYKHYERWATASDFPVENIINDGSTTLEDRLGAVADLELVVRSRKLQDDIMVVWSLCPWLMDWTTLNNPKPAIQRFFSVWADCWRHAVCRPKLWHCSSYSLLQVKGESFIVQVDAIYLVWTDTKPCFHDRLHIKDSHSDASCWSSVWLSSNCGRC